MVMIEGSWFNLDNLVGAKWTEVNEKGKWQVELHTVDSSLTMKISGPGAKAPWEFMKKHSYHITLEENNDANNRNNG